MVGERNQQEINVVSRSSNNYNSTNQKTNIFFPGDTAEHYLQSGNRDWTYNTKVVINPNLGLHQ